VSTGQLNFVGKVPLQSWGEEFHEDRYVLPLYGHLLVRLGGPLLSIEVIAYEGTRVLEAKMSNKGISQGLFSAHHLLAQSP
jgi:hypothetical protein